MAWILELSGWNGIYEIVKNLKVAELSTVLHFLKEIHIFS